MQDQKDTKTSANSGASPVAAADAAVNRAAQGDFVQKIVEKIRNSENILVALSKDPSVDEIAAAIGLTLYLDGMQKHTTAIYSGRTPEDLLFLKPDETFETNTDSLQDFIIALNKDKADHLRYKLEGDYVKVFITPYKNTITEEDLQFSHGDFNVDFVIAMNVASAGNLDAALGDHARIMHDASAVNITTGKAGRFGEIEWSNPAASSLCEMVTELIFAIQGNDEKALDKDVATALLTGIVAATERFSNNRTNPDTLKIASKLMTMGADQQLITMHVTGNEVVHNEPGQVAMPSAPVEKTQLEVDHGGPMVAGAGVANPAGVGTTGGAAAVGAAMNGVANGDGPMNPAAQQAPMVNMAMNPSPALVGATNGAAAEDVIVKPIIPGGGVAPVDPGQMQIPNTPVMQQTAPVNDPVAAHRAMVEEQTAAAVAAGTVGASNTVAPASGAGAQAASDVGTQVTPGVATRVADPSQMQIPGAPTNMTAAATGATDPSQMQIPGVPTNVTAAATMNTMAPASEQARPMAVSEPTQPETKQVGSTLQPPEKQPTKPKNYAEMMEEALAEPLPNVVMPMGMPEAASAPAGETMNLPGAASAGVAPISAPTVGTIGTPAAPVMEPVANPLDGILPPPPSPTAGMEMLPTLPPVNTNI